jgi:hypothetical protein
MSSYDDAVAGWYATLRTGDPITWSGHLAGGGRAPGTPVRVGAAHLEVVRRLAGRLGGSAGFSELADRVVGTAAFGRGRMDIPLPLPGSEPVLGPPPMDPEQVPAGELLRVAVPVLAEMLESGSAAPVTPVAPTRRPRRWGAPRVVVHGNPGLAVPLRAALRRAGICESGRSAMHVVLVAPVDGAVFGLWNARVRRGAAVRWRRIWERLAQAPVLPPAIDPGRVLDGLEGRVRRDRIHLVVADSPVVAAGHVAAYLDNSDIWDVGLPRWSQIDLARRLNWFHAARLDRHERAMNVAALLDLLDPGRVPDLGVPAPPPRLRSWAGMTGQRIGEALAERATAGGYAVHGDLEEVGRVLSGVNARPADGPAATLDTAIEAIGRAWRRP